MPVLLNLLKFVGAYMGVLTAGMTALSIGAGSYEYLNGHDNLPGSSAALPETPDPANPSTAPAPGLIGALDSQ